MQQRMEKELRSEAGANKARTQHLLQHDMRSQCKSCNATQNAHTYNPKTHCPSLRVRSCPCRPRLNASFSSALSSANSSLAVQFLGRGLLVLNFLLQILDLNVQVGTGSCQLPNLVYHISDRGLSVRDGLCFHLAVGAAPANQLVVNLLIRFGRASPATAIG